MPAKDDIIRFIAVHLEACLISVFTGLACLTVLLFAMGFTILAVILSLVWFAGLGLIVFLVLKYLSWNKSIIDHNTSVGNRNLSPGESLVKVSPDQYEAFLRDGYVEMPDGSQIISDKHLKSGKMKHIKLEDYEQLNGPIITEANKDYDGERILDYEAKYGKVYGKPTGGKHG